MIKSVSESAAPAPRFDTAKRRQKPPRVPDDVLPPHSSEAEQGVLGCILLDPQNTMATLLERRTTDRWFYELRHQVIYATCARLYDKKDGAIDLITLQQALKDAGALEEIGGISYLNAIQDAVPSAANLAYYVDFVWEKFRLRNLLAWATAIQATVYEHDGDIEKLYARVEAEFEALTAPVTIRTERHIKDVIQQSVIPQIERHYSRGNTQLDGLPTGQDWYLDKVLLGIAPSDYLILAGRPGEGKTSLALNIVDYLATKYVHWQTLPDSEYQKLLAAGSPEIAGYEWKEDDKHWLKRCVGIPVGVFTLEMTEDSLGFRLVFGHAQVSSGSFRQGFASESDWTAINKSVAELSKANIYLDGEPDQTIDMIAAKARRWAKQYGIKLFVLDYLQLLDGDNNDTDRVRALRKISKKIVSLKKRLGIPWLVLAQMNRNIETAERARRPVMSDLKESGSLEQDADKIVILYHPLKAENIEEDEDKIEAVMTRDGVKAFCDWPRRINALVVKNRNGPTGVAAMLFQNNQCLFHDWRRWQIEKKVVERAAGERGVITDEDIPQ